MKKYIQQCAILRDCWDRLSETKRTYGNNFVILFMTPEHDNLGDHAIALAEKLLIKDRFPQTGIFEISETEVEGCPKILRMIKLRTGLQPVLITGGGYMGTLWFNYEQDVRKIVSVFLNRPVIIFPQTIFYENTADGNAELRRSAQLYNRHSNLTICAREETTYKLVTEYYDRCKAYYCPDMALYLSGNPSAGTERAGVGLCLRQDSERTLTTGQFETIYRFASSVSKTVCMIDTRNPERVSFEERGCAVKNKLEEFRSFELIITDRLHGMIFSAITGTPCIVLSSKSPKIKGVYAWVQNLEYIKYADSPEQIGDVYARIKHRQFEYDNSNLLCYFDKLMEFLRGNDRGVTVDGTDQKVF